MAQHPFIDSSTLLRHSLFWLGYILYLAFSTNLYQQEVLTFSLPPALLTFLPVAIALTYLNLYVCLPHYYYSGRYVAYVFSVLLVLVIGGLIERYFFYAIWNPSLPNVSGHPRPLAVYWQPVLILRNIGKFYPLIVLTTLLKLMRNAYKHEAQLRALEREKFTAELSLLKAQINPHFFFNTLNSLYGLTLKGSDQASGVVLRLSELMQYMLYETRANQVLLRDEIRHLENYIGIEQLRFTDRLELSCHFSGDIEGKWIAPMLLQPFVENAFKHSLTGQAGWITIDLKVMGNRLFFKVDNSCQPVLSPGRNGLGIANVKRRLELMYPQKYELVLRANPDSYEADLKLVV